MHYRPMTILSRTRFTWPDVTTWPETARHGLPRLRSACLRHASYVRSIAGISRSRALHV